MVQKEQMVVNDPQSSYYASQIEPELLQRLDSLYAYYHKLWWSYKYMLNHYKVANSVLNGIALLLVALGMVIGPILENPLLVACLAAVGTLVKGWNDFKQFRFKEEMSRFAFTTYAKTLIELRTYVRGLPPDGLEAFLVKMQTLDDIITDVTPPLPKHCSRNYHRLHKYQSFSGQCYVDGSSKQNKKRSTSNASLCTLWVFNNNEVNEVSEVREEKPKQEDKEGVLYFAASPEQLTKSPRE